MTGELPSAAVRRMRRIRSGGPWGSALTCDEFAAIRGAGFEPVGQVFGAAVFGTGSASGYGCPGSFGPRVRALYEARQTAIDRMAAECAQLGGHGVVGVQLSVGEFLLGGLEFTAIGTAVRAPGTTSARPAVPPEGKVPFTSDVSGQDFAKLIMTGWVPVGLALGISIEARHDDLTTTRQARLWSGNAEVTGWTELVSRCRHDARRQLEGDVLRLGAEGVVIAGMPLRVSQRECPVTVGRRDHIVEVMLIGTAIARFAAQQARSQAGQALAVMPLNPLRRITILRDVT